MKVKTRPESGAEVPKGKRSPSVRGSYTLLPEAASIGGGPPDGRGHAVGQMTCPVCGAVAVGRDPASYTAPDGKLDKEQGRAAWGDNDIYVVFGFRGAFKVDPSAPPLKGRQRPKMRILRPQPWCRACRGGAKSKTKAGPQTLFPVEVMERPPHPALAQVTE